MRPAGLSVAPAVMEPVLLVVERAQAEPTEPLWDRPHKPRSLEVSSLEEFVKEEDEESEDEGKDEGGEEEEEDEENGEDAECRR